MRVKRLKRDQTAPPEASEQTREKILRAIAAEVGISAPALYWHFASKREICFAAVHDELRHFAYALRPSAHEPTPDAQLAQFVRTYVLLKLQQNGRLKEPGALGAYRQLREALTRKEQGSLDALQHEVYSLLHTILEAGEKVGAFRFEDATATTFAALTMCEYVFSWVRPNGRLAASEVAGIYKDLVLSMVGCRAAT
jgi:AcrR family transcriptional regulator